MSRPPGTFERQTGYGPPRLGGASARVGEGSLYASRQGQFGSIVESALKRAKRNPVATLVMAAGAGWLIYSMGRERTRGDVRHRRSHEAERIPVLNTGHARIYDPDASPLHPTQDSLESRREMSARL